MQKIEMYCVTDKEFQYLNELNYNLGAVGKDTFSNKYFNLHSLIPCSLLGASLEPPCSLLAASLQLFGEFFFPEIHLGVVFATFVQFLSNCCFRSC